MQLGGEICKAESLQHIWSAKFSQPASCNMTIHYILQVKQWHILKHCHYIIIIMIIWTELINIETFLFCQMGQTLVTIWIMHQRKTLPQCWEFFGVSVIEDVKTCFLVRPQLSEFLPAFGAGILQMAESRAARGNRGFHNPDPFSWCPTTPEICFLCRLSWPPIFFPSKLNRDKYSDWLTICSNGQRPSGLLL